MTLKLSIFKERSIRIDRKIKIDSHLERGRQNYDDVAVCVCRLQINRDSFNCDD